MANRRDQRSAEAQAWRRLYKTKQWLELRLQQLARRPLCERCSTPDRPVPATVVNHKVPHKGDPALFFDPDNVESVCAPCHDGPIQSEERRSAQGKLPLSSCGEDGWPTDPRHHWNV